MANFTSSEIDTNLVFVSLPLITWLTSDIWKSEVGSSRRFGIRYSDM